jgi:hypothetical protein
MRHPLAIGVALLALLLSTGTAVRAQTPAEIQAIGTGGSDIAPRAAWVVSPVFGRKWQTATAVAELPPGEGYLIAGQRDYNKPGQVAAWVMKVDRRGRTRWWRNFDDAREVRAYGLAALPDGGAFVAGSVGGPTEAKPWIARVSPKAWVFWERTLAAPDDAVWSGIEALAPAADGTLWAAGTDYRADGTSATWLLRLDAEGQVLARHALPVDGPPRGVSALTPLPDGSLALAGPLLPDADAAPLATARQDAWLARVAADGTLLWRHDLAGGPREGIAGLAPDGTAGGVRLAGWQADRPWPALQAWSRTYGPDGRPRTEIVFGEQGLEVLAGVHPDGDGGHWLIGATHPRPGSDAPATAWKRSLSADGWLGETQMLGSSAELSLEATARTRDGGLLAVGWRTIRRDLEPDIWIARFVMPGTG